MEILKVQTTRIALATLDFAVVSVAQLSFHVKEI